MKTMLNKFCYTMLLALFAASVAAGDVSPVPNRFRASIGGFPGVSYLVELRNGNLTYTEFGSGHSNPKPVVISPSATQWREFRQALDDLKVWGWQPKYPNVKVDDGTQWSLDIACADHAIKTDGDNSYPDANGKPHGKPRPTAAFNRYLDAVKKLTGGKTFQ
jgi:hypothetical protein